MPRLGVMHGVMPLGYHLGGGIRRYSLCNIWAFGIDAFTTNYYLCARPPAPSARQALCPRAVVRMAFADRASRTAFHRRTAEAAQRRNVATFCKSSGRCPHAALLPPPTPQLATPAPKERGNGGEGHTVVRMRAVCTCR